MRRATTGRQGIRAACWQTINNNLIILLLKNSEQMRLKHAPTINVENEGFKATAE